MQDLFYFFAGLVFLALAKAKYFRRGYSTPTTFSADDTERSVDYAIHVASRFEKNLELTNGAGVSGCSVLELGPGSDLGVGLILISRGAARYTALDRNDLVSRTPTSFYERLSRRTGVDLSALTDGRILYVVREDFDVAAEVPYGIDIVLSNAAFEHFDDVERTVEGISHIVRSGGRVVIEVDLMTHSRWIRDVDPNNIYRYPSWLYRLFRFPGQPNRVRPEAYRAAFERNGWTDVTLTPQNLVPVTMRDRRMSHEFDGLQMDWLSFLLTATRR